MTLNYRCADCDTWLCCSAGNDVDVKVALIRHRTAGCPNAVRPPISIPLDEALRIEGLFVLRDGNKGRLPRIPKAEGGTESASRWVWLEKA